MNEKYEYLFIDIEWNQKSGTTDSAHCEPIQIGLIGTDETLKCKKLFSKSIALEDVDTLTEQTCKIAHVTKTSVMQANPESVIFDRVRQSFPKYKFIVVWDARTYDIFKTAMRRTDLKIPRHRVLILRDIISVVALEHGETIGFETALMKAGVSYEKNYLHYSKHDVRYLHELFQKVYLRYEKLSSDEYCAVNSRTRIIHTLNCRYKCFSSHVVPEINAKRLIFRGYRPCKCCGMEEDWRKLKWKIMPKKERRKTKQMRMLSLTEKNIKLMCDNFNIDCNVVADVVFLSTNFGYWRIYLCDDKVKDVYHGNYKVDKFSFKKKIKGNEGFHKQNVAMDNFYDVLRYIYCHDKNMYKNNPLS